MSDSKRVTRGHGALEAWLARLRAAKADALIPDTLRDGRILDIGCGSYPYFLSNTRFAEKHGIDRLDSSGAGPEGIVLHNSDMSASQPLPFDDESFDVVTMLAVFEHLDRPAVSQLTAEIHRVLRPGGAYILTTPAAWTNPILQVLTFVRLISAEEIGEHEPLYGLPEIRAILSRAGFADTDITTGRFEVGLNTWVRAVK